MCFDVVDVRTYFSTKVAVLFTLTKSSAVRSTKGFSLFSLCGPEGKGTAREISEKNFFCLFARSTSLISKTERTKQRNRKSIDKIMTKDSNIDLPLGWGDRNNQMSEKDIKLGGVAATKFSTRNAYGEDSTASYKNSDQVREFYLNQDDYRDMGILGSQTKNNEDKTSSLPAFWETRQKERDLQEKQMNVFSRQSPPASVNPQTFQKKEKIKVDNDNQVGPEIALVKIATHTLETMAKALETNRSIEIPMAERAAFAKAIKAAMDVLAK